MADNLQAIKQRFGVIGNSEAYNSALKTAVRVAPTNLTVLITGESGAGKEVFSQIIHSLSPRKHNTLIAVNSGAIPEGTIDSELFGHEKGAFTGASDKRKGYFETADKGSLFLDEVGEIPLATQARLLRVLEAGEFIKVGSSKVIKTDVRLIAATNKDLFDSIQKGKFREDLFYRLATVQIKVPPLRERKEDIFLLFRKFAADFSAKYRTDVVKLDEEAQQLLISYNWPGNVRELKNIAEQLSVLSENRIVGKAELATYIPIDNPSRMPVLANHFNSNGEGDSYTERDLLYKMLFDMKSDINDLKKVLSQIIQGETDAISPEFSRELVQEYANNAPIISNRDNLNKSSAVVNDGAYVIHDSEAEEVEESLSIADKEQELIKKALIKHKGKRKDAALDLGISERTLYRKIKEYNINE